MKTYQLRDLITFAPDHPVKRHFLNAKGFHAALICLQNGVEISPHPEDYGVYFTVLQGSGIFTSGTDTASLSLHQGIYIKKDEVRGIQALEDLVVLGIQDRPKASPPSSLSL